MLAHLLNHCHELVTDHPPRPPRVRIDAGPEQEREAAMLTRWGFCNRSELFRVGGSGYSALSARPAQAVVAEVAGLAQGLAQALAGFPIAVAIQVGVPLLEQLLSLGLGANVSASITV